VFPAPAKTQAPQVVYVLVSAPPDHLVEMATVSVTALCMLSPEVKATVVMDPATLRGISGARARLLKFVDRVIEAPAQDQSPMARSRRIKTTLRELVAGDYLFLDVDAVPVKPIGAVFSTAAEFAAVYDGNMPPRQFVFHDFERQPFEAMGWPLPPGPYFNSGVKLVGIRWVFGHCIGSGTASGANARREASTRTSPPSIGRCWQPGCR
jgi:hypothetical protein